MEIEELAARVASIGAEVSAAAAGLRRADPGPVAFAGDGPGRLGELGRSLHAGWSAALAAREREAAAHGARLTELSVALGRADAGYRDVEQAARRRHDGTP
jgi:hypothetical protein